MHRKPEIVAVFGARGTGKTAWAVRHPAYTKARRLAVWDLMREAAHAHLEHFDQLGAFIRALRAKSFRIAFRPSADPARRAAQFDAWCEALLLAGNLTAHVEELAFVTSAHKAPPQWRRMILLGRHEQHRLTIIGTSQRPAQVDKEFVGNADTLHCGRLVAAGDAKAAASVLGVRADELQQLADLAYIERRQGDVAPVRGVLAFGQAAAPASRRSAKTGQNVKKPDPVPS